MQLSVGWALSLVFLGLGWQVIYLEMAFPFLSKIPDMLFVCVLGHSLLLNPNGNNWLGIGRKSKI